MEGHSPGRSATWVRPVLSATSLRWWSGLFGALLGTFMLVDPGQFDAAVYEALQDRVPLLGLVILAGGWAMLTVAALRPRQSVHAAAHVLLIFAFVLFAAGFAASHAWTGTAVYGALAAALVVSALLPASQLAPPGVRRGDLLAAGTGAAMALAGLFLVSVPLRESGVYSVLEGVSSRVGALMLVTGLLLVAVQAMPRLRRRWTLAVHVAAGATLIAAAVLVSARISAWSGVALYGGLGLLLPLLPWLRHRSRYFDAASLATRLALLLAGAASLPLALTLGLLVDDELVGGEAGRLTAFLAVLLIIALAAVFGIAAGRYIARPLRRLGEAADRLAAGEPAVPLERSGISEVDRLSANFGHMRDHLLERTRRAEVLAVELRRRADELAETDRRKDEFVAMLAHELRNPLGAVSSAVHLLADGGAEDAGTAVRAADVVRRQMHHLSRLVDDLLDVSRITRGKVPLHLTEVDLVEVLRRAVDTARSQFADSGVELEVDLPAGPVRLAADPTRLEQVFGNLLGNAAKYAQRGGRASLTAVVEEGREVTVRVRDDGVGIPGDVLPRVFDLFYQGAPTLDRADGGLGIGLTLVHKLVELHGGAVEAHSAGSDRGSEFVVRLPLSG